MIKVCLAFIAGNFVAQLSSFRVIVAAFIHAGMWLQVVIVGVCVALFMRQAGRVPASLLLGFALYAFCASDVLHDQLDKAYQGDSIVASIRIVDFVAVDNDTATIDASPVGAPDLPSHLRLSWYKPPVQPRFGDIWSLELRLQRPRGSSNPDGFDYEAWLFRERIGATGYVVNGWRNCLLQSGRLSVLEALRQRIERRIRMTVPDPEEAAILVAISIGARHLVTAQQWRRFAISGTSHLMAISGLHIGLAAAAAYFFVLLLTGVVRRPQNRHFTALAGSMLVAGAYALLSGLAVPAERAVLMISLVVVASLSRRETRGIAVLCMTAVAVLLVNPLASMTAGFKLSFGAVLLLIWFARQRRPSGRLLGQSSVHSRIAAVAHALHGFMYLQILLFVGLLPLTILEFQRIAPAAPLVNTFALPLFSLVTVPATLLGVLFDGSLHPVGDKLLAFAAFSVGWLNHVMIRVASVRIFDIRTAAIHGRAWLYLVLPLLAVVLPAGWPGRRLAWLGVAALYLYGPTRAPAGCAILHFLDVGQGLAVLVETRHRTLLYDTGPKYRSGSSAAERSILPYLQALKIDALDALVVSHDDLDHSGGVPAIVAAEPIGRFLSGEPLSETTARSDPCVAGDEWRWDGIDFRILHPPSPSHWTGNDASCLLLIQAGAHRALLTGDLEAVAEKALVRAGTLPGVDIVSIPHHGSRTSSTSAFVQALHPSLAVVSTGFGNHWGFPKLDVVGRWQKRGARVLNTATSGAVSVRLCANDGISHLVENRESHRHVWNADTMRTNETGHSPGIFRRSPVYFGFHD